MCVWVGGWRGSREHGMFTEDILQCVWSYSIREHEEEKGGRAVSRKVRLSVTWIHTRTHNERRKWGWWRWLGNHLKRTISHYILLPFTVAPHPPSLSSSLLVQPCNLSWVSMVIPWGRGEQIDWGWVLDTEERERESDLGFIKRFCADVQCVCVCVYAAFIQ